MLILCITFFWCWSRNILQGWPKHVSHILVVNKGFFPNIRAKLVIQYRSRLSAYPRMAQAVLSDSCWESELQPTHLFIHAIVFGYTRFTGVKPKAFRAHLSLRTYLLLYFLSVVYLLLGFQLLGYIPFSWMSEDLSLTRANLKSYSVFLS